MYQPSSKHHGELKLPRYCWFYCNSNNDQLFRICTIHRQYKRHTYFMVMEFWWWTDLHPAESFTQLQRQRSLQRYPYGNKCLWQQSGYKNRLFNDRCCFVACCCRWFKLWSRQHQPLGLRRRNAELVRCRNRRQPACNRNNLYNTLSDHNYELLCWKSAWRSDGLYRPNQ